MAERAIARRAENEILGPGLGERDEFFQCSRRQRRVHGEYTGWTAEQCDVGDVAQWVEGRLERQGRGQNMRGNSGDH